MDKDRMLNEATLALYDSEDADAMDRDMLGRRVRVAVEAAWREGMSLDELIAAARSRLART